MERLNRNLQITYNPKTNKIEVDPSRFILLLVTYKQISEDARQRMLKEIKQIVREG